MLILTRKNGERILIGPDIELTLLEVRGKCVRLGVRAPQDLPIHREEVRRRIEERQRISIPAEEIGNGDRRAV